MARRVFLLAMMPPTPWCWYHHTSDNDPLMHNWTTPRPHIYYLPLASEQNITPLSKRVSQVLLTRWICQNECICHGDEGGDYHHVTRDRPRRGFIPVTKFWCNTDCSITIARRLWFSFAMTSHVSNITLCYVLYIDDGNPEWFQTWVDWKYLSDTPPNLIYTICRQGVRF